MVCSNTAQNFHRGIKAFAFWAGRADIMNRPEELAAEANHSLLSRFWEIEKNLYFPPDENTKATGGLFLDTRTDGIFFEIADELHIDPKPFWPNSAPYAVCLTHDIDRIRLTYQTAAAKFRKNEYGDALVALLKKRPSREEDPYFNFQRIQRYEEDWGVRSAFYVLFEKKRFVRTLLHGEPQHLFGVYNPREITDILRMLKSRGFEIGLHGSFDAFHREKALRNELNHLASLLGTEGGGISGVRNHYLQFNRQMTPLIQNTCGVAYDSTVGFNFTCGFPCGTTFPFPFFFGNNGTHVELPLNVMDTALKYAAPTRETEVGNRIADEVKKRGGLLMINWHSHFCNKDTEPVMYNWVEQIINRAVIDRAYMAKPMVVANFFKSRAFYNG